MSSPVAVVTGGNRGIGFEVCAQIGAAGHRVILTSRERDAGEEAVHSLRARGVDAESLTLDVCDEASVRAFGDSLAAEHDAIDVLVNNAGIALDGFDAAIAERTIATNFFGPLRVYDALVPLLRPRKGRVVMVSSGMGDRSCLGSERRERFLAPMSRDELVQTMRDFVTAVGAGRHEREGWPSSAYRISKIGLNKLVEVLAPEAPGPINAVCPGWVRTRMGGAHAPRTPEQGARTITWLAVEAGDGPTGGFFRDEAPAEW